MITNASPYARGVSRNRSSTGRAGRGEQRGNENDDDDDDDDDEKEMNLG